MVDYEPKRVPNSLTERTPVRSRERLLPKASTQEQAQRQVMDLYLTIGQQLKDPAGLSPTQIAGLKVQHVWCRFLIPNLPQEEVLLSEARQNELRSIMADPAARDYLMEIVSQERGKPIMRAAQLRDEIQQLVDKINN